MSKGLSRANFEKIASPEAVAAFDKSRSVPKAPWYVEREDDEDGSINYHVWSKEPVTWLFTVYGRDHLNAKAIAELVVTAVNTAINF